MNDEEGEWEYYIVHDSIGVSHIHRKRRDEPQTFHCVYCSEH
jgi:hypothetical protein